MTHPPRGLPDQTRGPFGAWARDISLPAPARYRGRGLQMVELWNDGRRAAGLPDTDHWDGALVSLAMALMSGREVETLAADFAHSRRGLMSPEQIEQDVELGFDALRSTAETAPDPGALRAAALAGIRRSVHPERR